MSFGLCIATHHLQRFKDDIIRYLEICFAYIDDILIFSHSPPGKRPSLLHPLHPTTELWHLSEHVQVRFPCTRNFLLGIQNPVHGTPAPSRT